MKQIRVLCILCAVLLLICPATPALAQADESHQAASYAHILEDYIKTYGVMETSTPGERLPLSSVKNGLAYAQYLELEAGQPPCLVIFLADTSYKVASCHIWKYTAETGEAQRAAVIDRKLDVSQQRSGEFGIGTAGGQPCIVYTTYENDAPVASSCFTILNGQPVQYMDTAPATGIVGVLDFNGDSVHSGVDVSAKNKQFTAFYDSLKKEAGQSSVFANQLKDLSSTETASLRTFVSSILPQQAFDLLDYDDKAAYEQALLQQETSTVTLYSISSLQDIGDHFYRISFSTNQSLYNDAVLYNGQNGYQLLHLGLDTVPLSDRELVFLKKQYQQHPFLAAPSATPVIATKQASSLPVREIRIWTACIGSGVSLVLLLWLWFFLSVKRKTHSSPLQKKDLSF